MTLREELERLEHEHLDPKAAFADESRGRLRPEEPRAEDVRTVFQRDVDKIVHSKAFRRLMHKTQVFLSPEGDHYRTRMTHTIEVSRIARTIAKALNLNEDLAEAIAMGHDLGHTPFGHAGEVALTEATGQPFRHNEQSLRVVDLLEDHKGRPGMNLTFEVRDGIVNHTGSLKPATPEGEVVKISDRIAYINHDIDDAIRSGVLTLADLPEQPIRMFGKEHGERISNMVQNVVENSDGKPHVAMDEEHMEQLTVLRSFMFRNVYKSSKVKKASDVKKTEFIISALYEYFASHPEELPKDMGHIIREEGPEAAAKDHVAGMTDRYAMRIYQENFFPEGLF
jgi:dGTPase